VAGLAAAVWRLTYSGRRAAGEAGPGCPVNRGRPANLELGETVLQTRSLATAITLLGLALADCGGSSAPSLSAFKSGFSTEKAQFRKLGLDLQTATQARSKTDAALASELTALATRAEQTRAQLTKLDAPSKFKANLSKLESRFGAVGTDLKQIAGAATKHDAATARAATMMLLRDAATVKSADVALTSGLGLPASS